MAVMGSNPSLTKGDNLPVGMVQWDDCQEFIRKLNSLTGQNFRLPTEAEWEFACRGGNNSRGYKYSGSNCIDDVAWYKKIPFGSFMLLWFKAIGRRILSIFGKEFVSPKMTAPVATKAPNELGIYDMSGNVFEWCSDWYGDYSIGAQTNPKGPCEGDFHVSRGGCWGTAAEYCRSSCRHDFLYIAALEGHGLRLAL